VLLQVRLLRELLAASEILNIFNEVSKSGKVHFNVMQLYRFLLFTSDTNVAAVGDELLERVGSRRTSS
jgi:hypothetical protein